MKKFKKILAGVLAGAMAIGMMSMSAFASTEVPVAADGTFVLTVDTTGAFVDGEGEYAMGWFQTYGTVAPTITKVTMTYDGAEVDITEFAVLDGTDGNYTSYIVDNTDEDGNVVHEGYFDDLSTVDKVTAISYYVTLGDFSVADGAYVVWSGGAIGSNSKGAGWKSAGQWTTAVEDKEFVLSLPATEEEPAEVGDTDTTTGVADYSFLWIALAAAAATVAGTTVVLKKREEM